jgi:hypothetical protein
MGEDAKGALPKDSNAKCQPESSAMRSVWPEAFTSGLAVPVARRAEIVEASPREHAAKSAVAVEASFAKAREWANTSIASKTRIAR